MPNGMSAKQYFEKNSQSAFVNEVLNFSAVYLLPAGQDGKQLKLTSLDQGFKEEHDRFFVLEQDEATQQWKRVSLVEKFGETIFSTPAFNANPDMVEALYDIVNAGNLFFYNRGEAEPLQFTFRKATPTSKDVHVLPSPTNDPRLAEINAQRREQVKDEMQRYEAYRAEANKQKVLDKFKVLLPDKMVNARQRAHNALSLATPGPLEFLGGKEVTLTPVTINGSPRYSAAEIETIVLAACDSQRAAAKNTSYPGMSNKDKMTLGLGFGVHEDMLVTGRKESDKDLVPVFEEGRKFAAELIEQEIGGNGKPLKNAMMNSLRNHILACRERPSLDVQSLRMFEEVGKMASMMAMRQLYTNKKEFDQLEAEAKAMAVVAKAVLAGAQAEKELQEAQRKGKFTDEKQRESIVGRIVTARYFTARHYQAVEEQTADPKIQNIQNKLKDLSVKEMQGQITPAKREVEYNKLLVQQTRSYKLPSNIHEIMNEMKQRDGAPEIRFWDYAAITAEGKKLMAHTDPFKMIEELTKLSNLTATNAAATTLTTEMNGMRTNRMDSLTANNFWKSMQRAMGDDQFDLKVMPDDFSRLVILQEDGSGNRSLVPLKETLDITIQDTLVRSMDDAAMMDRIRNQLAQGNVFFYERGQNVPHRLSLNEKGMVVRSAEPVQAKQPSGWARFMNLLFPGRFYREEFAAHAQESYLRDETVTTDRATKAANEEKAYEDAKNAVVRENRKKALIDKADTLFKDMSVMKQRAHHVLSLDDPKTVSFAAGTPDYTGTAFPVPENVKKLFTVEELDALCLAGISSPAAAEKFMQTPGNTFGNTPEIVALEVDAHIYHDILSAGRENTHIFFPLVNAGREEAATALEEYAQDKPERMAKLLGNAIRTVIIAGRADEGVKSNTAMATGMAMKMMDMLDRDAKLKANCGIDENTLNGYRQELKGLRMIGEAYENADKAYRKLAQAIKDNRNLSEEESLEIATDLQTYRYLNTLQCVDHDKAAAGEEISLASAHIANQKLCYDLKTDELLDPRKPDNMMKIASGKVRMQYFTKEEEHQRTYELKLMYDALPYIVALGDDSLENVRNHVKMNQKVQDLSKFTDPVAFGNHFDQYSSTQQDSNLHKEVSNSRSDAQKQANKNRLQEINNQIKQLSSASKGPEINPAPEPQLQSAPNVSKPAAPVIGP